MQLIGKIPLPVGPDNGARGELRYAPSGKHRRPAALMPQFLCRYWGTFRLFSVPGARQASFRRFWSATGARHAVTAETDGRHGEISIAKSSAFASSLCISRD